MNEQTFLNNHLLIAMPNLSDPNFYHSVSYICEHSEQGAMGIVINHLSDVQLGEVLEQMNITSRDPAVNASPILLGGPLGLEQGFILHTPKREWKSTLIASDEIAITTSRDILESIAEGDGPDESLISLGYSGWEPGQLEAELADNAWIIAPATREILFELPVHERWAAAAASIGIDFANLSGDVGHA